MEAYQDDSRFPGKRHARNGGVEKEVSWNHAIEIIDCLYR